MIENVAPRFVFSYASARVKVYHANKGQGLLIHSHAYSHATMCNAGSCVVRKAGKEVVMNKDTQPINLIAGEWHEVEALEDGTVFVNIFEDGKIS